MVPKDRLRSAAVVMASMLYSLIRVVLDAIATSHHNEAKLSAEVLALRQPVQVLERQIKRVRWEPADRMILAALRERLLRSAWAALLVHPETVLGWHRELVRRRWAAYRGRPRTGRPPLADQHLVAPVYDVGLPSKLSPHPEQGSGLLMLNTTAAALVSENKAYSFRRAWILWPWIPPKITSAPVAWQHARRWR